MEVVAVGRTAEVFALGKDRVVKLDRVEWNGVSHLEAGVLAAAYTAGLPVPKVYETVTIDGRPGVVLERLRGPSLSKEILTAGSDIDKLAQEFVELHQRLQTGALPGVPELVLRVDDELKRTTLPTGVSDELRELLAELADGERNRLCHFVLHPENIIITERRWVVIDWLTAASGPAIADHARTLLLRSHASDPVTQTFTGAVSRCAGELRGFGADAVASWTRVLAGARLAEGFRGPYADWLTTIATKAIPAT